MTQFLPLSTPAGSRGLRPLPMQFAAPFYSAEACGYDAVPDRDEDAGLPSGAAFVLALPLALLICSGALYWLLA